MDRAISTIVFCGVLAAAGTAPVSFLYRRFAELVFREINPAERDAAGSEHAEADALMMAHP
ncbi:MAG TPA: hypothetical protein VMW18_08175 [Candidatus Binatia bacterium]|nr:hypothetical protein [Candidatus Binatia bacterium]